MAQYLPILCLGILAAIFAGASFFASGLLAPKRPTLPKEAPYECGIVPEHEPSDRFPVRFYLVAMIFVIFDIELIFLYPWAVVSNRLGRFGLVEMILFSLAVFVSLLYLLGNGALSWGPSRRVARPTSDQSPVRTTTSTVRKVGRDSFAAPLGGSAGAAARHHGSDQAA